MDGIYKHEWGYMANQLVNKETGDCSSKVYFRDNSTTIDFYLLYENSYRVIKGVKKATPDRKSSGQF